MTKRNIIEIDENKCNGCGECVPNCPEGALKIVDGKAKVVDEVYCDGLGACIGHCPQDAIKVVKREAAEYDEKKVIDNISKHGKEAIKEHLHHLHEHGQTKELDEARAYLKSKSSKTEDMKIKTSKRKAKACSCPGAQVRDLKAEKADSRSKDKKNKFADNFSLNQWPVQLNLLPPNTPFFEDAHILICADCVAYANPSFYTKLLEGKALAIGCPKLDDVEEYQEKLEDIFRENKTKEVTVAIMEVPCCRGLWNAVEMAARKVDRKIKVNTEIVSIR